MFTNDSNPYEDRGLFASMHDIAGTWVLLVTVLIGMLAMG